MKEEDQMLCTLLSNGFRCTASALQQMHSPAGYELRRHLVLLLRVKLVCVGPEKIKPGGACFNNKELGDVLGENTLQSKTCFLFVPASAQNGWEVTGVFRLKYVLSLVAGCLPAAS